MRVIRGKQALITGAASGIGRAIALALAPKGRPCICWTPTATDWPRSRPKPVSSAWKAVAERCDVGNRDEVSAAVRTLLRRWGTLDILVNNAGLAYYGPTLNMTVDQWDR